MDNYRKEWIDGVTPLVFAVDTTTATAVPKSKEGLGDDDSNRKPKDSFALFYEYMISQKRNQAKVQQSVASDNPSTDVRKTLSRATKNLSSFDILSGRGGDEKSDFFSHARVVPVSHRHAFPPSKDPHGNQNAISKLNSALYAVRNQKTVPAYDPHSDRSSRPISPITAILAKNPVLGILPEGWIEKHTHALPSTIMIVTSLELTASSDEQGQMEQHLVSTIQNITSSCAKKRESPIHVVCLVGLSGAVATPKDALVESEWVANIKSTCRLTEGSVTCLHYYEDVDSQTGQKVTMFLQNDFEKLQKAVEDESMLYYLTQVRRCKRKYSLLHHGKFPELQPFAVRYCIKIAMFYEFQGCVHSERREKSSRYWKEAYRILKDYYLYLQGIGSDKMKNSVDAVRSVRNNGTVSMENREQSNGGNTLLDDRNVSDAHSEYIPDDGVEVALLDAPRGLNSNQKPTSTTQNMDDGSSTVSAVERKKSVDSVGNTDDDQEQILIRSRDMFQQCRSVADMLNIKLLLINYGHALESLNKSNNINSVESSHDFTFKTIARQIRTHIQVFLSPPNNSSVVHNYNLKDPMLLFLSFVARQRFVMSEFLQKHPIPSNLSASIDVDTLSYCNAFHHYVTCGKMYLRLDEAMQKVINESLTPTRDKVPPKHDDRQRFVGGASLHDIELSLDAESKRDQLGLALESFKRATEVASEQDRTSTRSMSSINYYMGKIHMKRCKFKLAADLLKKARSQVQGFPLIQIAVDTALSKCLEKFNPASCIDVAAMQLLNCEQNGLLTNDYISSLCAILKNRDVAEMNWRKLGEPLQYSFTFPYNIYASEGDRIKGILHVRSNLPFPISIEKIEIRLNVGKVIVNERKIVLPYKIVRFVTMVTIPIGCMNDIDAKILERQSIKNPRPNTFGLTQIGGAVLGDISPDKLSGGFVIACLSADFLLSLHPQEELRFVINIQNRHRGSFPVDSEQVATNKRSAMEEDNFLFSAWDRPDFVPVSFGPRCLRLFRSYSHLEITNLTSKCTKDKAMEGTVNRLVLKLQPGVGEHCRNVKMGVRCFSWLESGLVDPQNASDGLEVHNSTFLSRLPVIVEPAPHGVSKNDDYCLPGWKLLNSDNSCHVADSIDGGSDCFVPFYLYRPLDDESSDSDCKCMTKYTVNISYERNTLDPVGGRECVESVLKSYQGTISWCAPLETKFDVIRQKEYIAASVNNIISRSSDDQIDNPTVISGTEVILTCSAFCPEAASNISVKLDRATFQPTTEKTVNVSLVKNKKGIKAETLYDAKEDFSSELDEGSRFKISCSLRPALIETYSSELRQSRRVSCPLGSVSIAFTPKPLSLPHGTCFLQEFENYSKYHGPLPLKDLPPIKRMSPRVTIEMTPFDASFETIPSVPTVASPFEVRYAIINKSHFHQRLRISMVESEGAKSGMLISGTVNGNLVLGPGEEKHIWYTILIAKVGETELPTLNVYSLRYNEFIVHNCTRSIFVMP